MNGHQALIALRQQRMAPKIVFVNDYPCKTDWHELGDAVTICTHGDVIQLLDLRFLVGMTVSISSPNEIRARALYAACKAAGAKTVAACHIAEGKRPWEQTGWAHVWHKAREVVHG